MTRAGKATRAEVEAVAILLWQAAYGKRRHVVTEELRDLFNHDLHWQRDTWLRAGRRAIALGATPPRVGVKGKEKG